jgi:hypothetical protein
MKRRRATDAASRPVDGEVVDVSADSDAEAAKRKVLVNVVFRGAASPPSKLEIEEGTTVKQFRRSVFGLQDAGETITFRVGQVTIEFHQGGDLGTLFDLADKEAQELVLLEGYMPAQVPQAELEAMVRAGRGGGQGGISRAATGGCTAMG